MVPGKFINLLPPQITKPKVSAVGRAPAVPVPSSGVPKFTKPDLFIPDNFWSNLKQFLTERPVKVRERKDAPFTHTRFGFGPAWAPRSRFSCVLCRAIGVTYILGAGWWCCVFRL